MCQTFKINVVNEVFPRVHSAKLETIKSDAMRPNTVLQTKYCSRHGSLHVVRFNPSLRDGA